MIPIHICEDDQGMLDFLRKKITDICMFEEYDFEVTLAATQPEKLLNKLSANPTQGIYFLDVELQNEKLNGFELGKQIRQLDTRGFIVYITTHTELLSETFKYRVEAMDYITKDDSQHLLERIALSLAEINNRCKQDRRAEKEFFSVQRMNDSSYVPLAEIIYFETSAKKHVLNLVTEEAFIEFYGKLADIQEQLGEKFIRTHRSYLVNCDYIAGIVKKEKLVQLTNGNTVLLSRNKINDVNIRLSEQKGGA